MNLGIVITGLIAAAFAAPLIALDNLTKAERPKPTPRPPLTEAQARAVRRGLTVGAVVILAILLVSFKVLAALVAMS
jgi:hypothetical protein